MQDDKQAKQKLNDAEEQKQEDLQPISTGPATKPEIPFEVAVVSPEQIKAEIVALPPSRFEVIDTIGLAGSIAAIATVFVIYLQQRIIKKQLEQNEEQLQIARDQIELAKKADDNSRIVRTTQFLLDLESNRDYLESRSVVANIRDEGGSQAFLKLVEGYLEDKKESRRYMYFINFMNIYELVATGIENGVFDEDTWKKYNRAAFVRNVIAVRSAVAKIRHQTQNYSIFIESENLARKWADGASERAQLRVT